MAKKKQKKQQSEDDGQVEQESDSVGKGKKSKKNTTKKAPAKKQESKPKQKPKQKQKQKTVTSKKNNKNGPSKKDLDGDQQLIDKKKDFLPGQQHQTPQQDDGARAFYSSLYAQNPDSQMAKRYCLKYGLLDKEDAIKVQKQLAKKK